MALTFRIENEQDLVDALEKLGIDAAKALRPAVEAGAIVIKDRALDRAPGPEIDTAPDEKSAQSVTFNIGPLATHWYYRFFETGTAPHEITPRAKKALAFGGPGAEKFSARAQHQGQPAEPFLRPAIDDNQEEIKAAIGAVLLSFLES